MTAAAAAGPMGLIAGSGSLPIAIAEGVRRHGRPVICINVFDADPALERLAETSYTVALGELGGVIAALRRHGVREVLLAGKVDKMAAMASTRLDAVAMQAARRMTDFRDASILGALVAVLEDAGFTVADQTRYIGHLVPVPGVLGARRPTAEELRDIELGRRIAAGVAALDIGQAVAVRHGVIVAVEAAEGTDAMIRRAGALAPDIVVVKVSRPRQDPRYDLPVVGAQTIEALAASSGTALAVEAGRTILVERDRLVAAADALGVAVVASSAPPDP